MGFQGWIQNKPCHWKMGSWVQIDVQLWIHSMLLFHRILGLQHMVSRYDWSCWQYLQFNKSLLYALPYNQQLEYFKPTWKAQKYFLRGFLLNVCFKKNWTNHSTIVCTDFFETEPKNILKCSSCLYVWA